MIRIALAVLVHLLPLVAIAFGHKPAAAALALGVVAIYIKDRKLTAMLGEITGEGPRADQERREIIAARRRWRYLMVVRPADATSADDVTPSRSDV